MRKRRSEGAHAWAKRSGTRMEQQAPDRPKEAENLSPSKVIFGVNPNCRNTASVVRHCLLFAACPCPGALSGKSGTAGFRRLAEAWHGKPLRRSSLIQPGQAFFAGNRSGSFSPEPALDIWLTYSFRTIKRKLVCGKGRKQEMKRATALAERNFMGSVRDPAWPIERSGKARRHQTGSRGKHRFRTDWENGLRLYG